MKRRHFILTVGAVGALIAVEGPLFGQSAAAILEQGFRCGAAFQAAGRIAARQSRQDFGRTTRAKMG